VCDNPRQWNLALPQAEFALNSSINISIGKYAFQVVYGANPKGIVDLVDLPANPYFIRDATDFLENICEIHQQIEHKLQSTDEQDKKHVDLHRRKKVFQEGEMVMIHLRKERYRKGTYHKLRPKKFGPCKIMKRINENAYLIDLLEDLDISPIFNVVDLHSHSVGTNDDQMDDDQNEKEDNWTQHLPKKKRKQVERVLDTKLFATRSKSYKLYFVKWEGLPNSYNNWIIETDLLKYNRIATPSDLEPEDAEFLKRRG
jgi:hypothetical protein